MAGEAVPDHFDVLIDSDAFVGWLYVEDAHHEEVSKTFDLLEHQKLIPATTNLVLMETATVLSHKSGQALAGTFLDLMSGFAVVNLDETLQEETISLFKLQEAKGTSMVDCSNVVIMRAFEIPFIFSFDKFYAKHDLKYPVL